MRLADRFNELEHELPAEWASAQFVLTAADETHGEQAAALLAPTNPGRAGRQVRFVMSRHGAGAGPEAVRRLLRRLDREGLTGGLELAHAESTPVAEAEAHARTSLRSEWERAVAALPPDWSDVYAEVRLDSTDYLDRAALLLAPVNPARYGDPTGFRFRSARRFGYGVSPEMAARCLERCDEDGITGAVEILRALSDSRPVATQGPVWYVGGRSV
ncbi:MAG TPA: hypothetical protein VEH52_00455 [Gaiellaceae bacterium]|nr:hypothetical protein [Gaiellaceae bacterium]